MKKLFVILYFSGVAFANNPENLTAYDQAKFKISDTDMQIFIRQMNNIEQCIFLDLAVYAKWSETDHLTMFYFQQQLLKELLGERYFKMLEEDVASQDYFNAQYKKFDHQKANVDAERCSIFKGEYQKIYQRILNLQSEQPPK